MWCHPKHGHWLLCAQVQIGFTCLGLGLLLTAIICSCCVIIVKFARSFASGTPAPRPANPVGGALYDVSAKYGSFIPGGTALGHPVQGPGAHKVSGDLPSGKPPYNGDTSYDSGPPAGYPGGGTSGAYGGGGGVPPPGGTAPMYSRPADSAAGAPPPGYPSV
jgi:hypothetical protein